MQKDKTIEAFVDSLNSKTPYRWGSVGIDVSKVEYDGEELSFWGAIPAQLLDPELRTIIPSYCINHIHELGIHTLKKILDNNCTIVFNMYTDDKSKIEYTYRIAPESLRKRYDGLIENQLSE